MIKFRRTKSGNTDIEGEFIFSDMEIIYHSLTFSFLIKQGETINASEFAKRIANTYDTSNPRTNAVCQALNNN